MNRSDRSALGIPAAGLVLSSTLFPSPVSAIFALALLFTCIPYPGGGRTRWGHDRAIGGGAGGPPDMVPCRADAPALSLAWRREAVAPDQWRGRSRRM